MLCTESLTAESLHSRLLAGTLKVVDVLREKAAMLAVKRRNREISTFVAKNIAGLLHEALFGGSATVRETAMKLISFNNKTIIGAICDCEELEKIAAELLQSSALSVLGVAQSVGYASASQFTAAFRRQYGLTPSQYRKKSESA